MNRLNLRFQWFLYTLMWSCVGPTIFIAILNQRISVEILTAGLMIGLPMATGLYLFVFHLAPFVKRATFIVSLILQIALLWLMLTISFLVGFMTMEAMGTHSSPFRKEAIQHALAFMQIDEARLGYYCACGGILGLVMYWQISRKLGPGVLWNWITGRYHRPREEDRIFMFLDIRGSTTLAEQLGNLKFSGMIRDFMVDLTNPVLETQGEVSHYIGDEAVLTWTLKNGLKKANCVRCFFLMRDEIAARASVYQEKYGIVPEFKAGIHLGRVVACEVGSIKSEVVFHGDVLNTAARIQGLCDKLGGELLVSKQLQDAMTERGEYAFESKGAQQLKGKAEEMEVFAVTPSSR